MTADCRLAPAIATFEVSVDLTTRAVFRWSVTESDPKQVPEEQS